MARDLAIGIGVAAPVIWLTFFGTVGAVEVATLVVAVGATIWFATVQPSRLVDGSGRPQLLLFGLTAVGVALLFTSAVAMGTGTMFLIALVGAAGAATGLVRAAGRWMRDPGEER